MLKVNLIIKYINIKQAKNNKFKISPSPLELSKKLLINEKMKPIRAKCEQNKNKTKLFLLEGRLRFWAWVIAFEWKKNIPTLIWYND